LPNYTIIFKNKPEFKDRPMTRVFSKSNKLKFATDLASTNWSDIYNHQDANDAYNAFSTRISKLFETNFPLTKLSRAQRQKVDYTWTKKK